MRLLLAAATCLVLLSFTNSGLALTFSGCTSANGTGKFTATGSITCRPLCNTACAGEGSTAAQAQAACRTHCSDSKVQMAVCTENCSCPPSRTVSASNNSESVAKSGMNSYAAAYCMPKCMPSLTAESCKKIPNGMYTCTGTAICR